MAASTERLCASLRNPSPATLGRLGVPARYRSARLTDFSGEALSRALNGDGLYVSGGPGVGKTHLATARFVDGLICAIDAPDPAEEYVRPAEISARWVTVPDLLAEFRSTFGDRGRGGSLRAEGEEDVHGRYCRYRLLLLDDLGAEKQTDWTGQAVYRIVSARLNDLLPTIVTSNLSLTELNAADPRLASRLAGMAYLRLAGADRRLG